MNNYLLGLTGYLYFWFVIMLSIIVHELGHLLVALWCKVKVETFCIGFGKPIIWKRKWKGITWQITPWILGGYTELYGENSKKNKGFLAQRWLKKVAILLAGVTMNLLLAFACYLIMYKSIITGLKVDFTFMKILFTRDYMHFIYLLEHFNFNFWLIQISFINMFCLITNILPLPCLDGGQIWLVWCEKLFKKKKDFENFNNKVNKIGFWFLMIAQVFIVVYFLFFR